jgi:5-methylcytosine-specific restriction endonuclease McrA
MPIKSLKPSIQVADIRHGSSVGTERIRGGRLRKIRDRIGLRDEYTCRMCGHVTAHGEVDHKTPLALGGTNAFENLQWLCSVCHEIKTEQEQKDREGIRS